MKREDLDKAINAISEEQRELENKISALKAKKMELQRQYVSEYPNKIKRVVKSASKQNGVEMKKNIPFLWDATLLKVICMVVMNTLVYTKIKALVQNC